MTLKVKMLPHLSWYDSSEGGIHTVIRHWWDLLPDYGIELVDPKAKRYDLLAVHAGSLDLPPPKEKPIVSHLHGIYFTADYEAHKYEWQANRKITNILHYANQVTVPSAWVAETIQRDLRYNPHIVSHGVDWDAWQHDHELQGYVLAYGKNRVGDVCDNSFVVDLARQFPEVDFICTFAPKNAPANVIDLGGTIPYERWKTVIQAASVVVSPAKETFGLLTLEAMAAGKPILGINKGGNIDLVTHGETGYLYDNDMAEGLDYCLQYGAILGDNGREAAKAYTWQSVAGQIAGIYQKAMETEDPTVSVVIPVYNKPVEQVARAVQSCLDQSRKPERIILVDDGSDQDYDQLTDMGNQVILIRQENQGVAAARNKGIASTDSKYICCLDSDDWLDSKFLEMCVSALEADNSLALAYTGLTSHEPDGRTEVSPGNPQWDYDRNLNGQNTVWTCNVFRRKAWERLGGYRSRYCPDGAGSEDAELWLRMGAYGFKAAKIDDRGLFHYSWKTGQVTGNPDYKEPDWRAWHPWVEDKQHPLASYATPTNNISHPVRQYDEPIISVIIPVGPDHEHYVIDALDSLEAQRFRKWEAVVINDTGDHDKLTEILIPYPYVRYIDGGDKPQGAGAARNRGVEIARAPLILFLDADDTLRPIDTLSKMLDYWNRHQSAIYTDYVGQANIDEESARQLQDEGRIEGYEPKTGEAIIIYQRSEFNCLKAIKEPTTLETAYNWNTVSTLFPKAWHDDIGGFDEAMETLEDWDYWLRLVKAGHCFKHLPETLIRYRLRAGQRHIQLDNPSGRQTAYDVLEYIKAKHETIEIVDRTCGCEENTNHPPSQVIEEKSSMNDADFVAATYTGKRGNHNITGANIFNKPPGELYRLPNLRHKRRGDGYVIYYGYSDQGLETLVHKKDVALMPGKWQVRTDFVVPRTIERKPLPPKENKKPLDALAEAREKIRAQAELAMVNPNGFELESMSAVTPAIAARMRKAGLDTRQAITTAGLDGLMTIKGIGKTRAEAILSEVQP